MLAIRWCVHIVASPYHLVSFQISAHVAIICVADWEKESFGIRGSKVNFCMDLLHQPLQGEVAKCSRFSEQQT